MKMPFFSLLKIILEGKASIRFFIGVILSLGFSISVILSTIGLMDGFEQTLKDGLRKSTGDIFIYNRSGFFSEKKISNELTKIKLNYTPIAQIEAFAMNEFKSKGVLIKGIQNNSFRKITGMNIKVESDKVAIGVELAKILNLKINDYITLAFAKSRKQNSLGPIIVSYQIQKIVKHGIYDKDLRFIYINSKDIAKVLNLPTDKFNVFIGKFDKAYSDDEIIKKIDKLDEKLKGEYIIRPFWSEFETLLEAVEVEKFSITLILQLIVIVAIFNIFSFIIFISEKKSKDIFMLRALGLSIKQIRYFWICSVFFIWSIGCIISLILTFIFNYLLGVLPVFQLPGDIYVLSQLSLKLNFKDTAFIFFASLIWIIVISLLASLRSRKKSLIHGIRSEYV